MAFPTNIKYYRTVLAYIPVAKTSQHTEAVTEFAVAYGEG